MDRRKLWNRSARRAVLWWLGAFLLLQVGLSVSLDTWLGLWRNPNYSARHQRLRHVVESHPDRPFVLVAGSSRTMNGLRPGILPDDGHGPLLVNWGFPGHAPAHLALRLERLLREGPRPNAIVLEVVPALLTTGANEYGAVPAINHRWDDLPSATRIIPADDLAHQWRDARLMPWFAYRYHIMDWVAPGWQPAGYRNDAYWRMLDEWGWVSMLATATDPEARRSAVAYFAPMLKRPEIHPDQVHALRYILATCRCENIPLTVLVMPEGPEFRTAYAPGVRQGLDAGLKSLCDEFKVEWIDARNWFDTEEVFCDGHHLLPEGARQFTQRFSTEILPRLCHAGENARVVSRPLAEVAKAPQ